MAKTKTFVLCDSSRINSYGFKTDLNGMDTERFKANPVMLYRHNTEDVIGRWQNLRIDDGKLMADAEFDNEDDVASKVEGKVGRGFLNGCSIGICIKSMKHTEVCDIATETELLEASICAIPSDAGAVSLYDKDLTRLTYEQVQLQFNNTKTKQTMEEKELQSQLTTVQAELEQAKKEKATAETEKAELQKRITEMEKSEREAFLTSAVESGKISEKEKESFAKLAVTDYDTVKTLINDRKANGTEGHHSLAAQLNNKGKYNGKTWDELDRAGKLSELKAQDPDMYKRLFDEKFK